MSCRLLRNKFERLSLIFLKQFFIKKLSKEMCMRRGEEIKIVQEIRQPFFREIFTSHIFEIWPHKKKNSSNLFKILQVSKLFSILMAFHRNKNFKRRYSMENLLCILLSLSKRKFYKATCNSDCRAKQLKKMNATGNENGWRCGGEKDQIGMCIRYRKQDTQDYITQ